MSDSRRLVRHLGPLGALTAVVALGASMLGAAHFAAGHTTKLPAYARAPRPAAGVLPTSGTSSLHPEQAHVGVASAPVSLRYTFDGGVDRPITAENGGYRLRPLGQNGGALSLVPQGLGLAVEYPQRCTLVRDRDCPRAILEGDRDDALNPGTRPLSYGASVLMTHSDLADGANVFQKGYSVGGVSQFKLQVDHEQGHPSCVIAGQRAIIYRAEPDLDVADGTWHDLACVRTGNRLSIFVDGAERAWVKVPKKLSIANSEPLRVGGKGADKGNDQFAGMLDNVFMTIG
jgi:hypothetical protein